MWSGGSVAMHGVDIYELVYYDLVPKLLCNPDIPGVSINRDYMHSNVSIKTVQEELKSQHSLMEQANKEISESRIHKTKVTIKKRIIPTSNIPESTSVLRKLWDYVTYEQFKVWNTERQVIFGPYGSGKTVLIQCKAADLANSGEKVIIILPSHLITKYRVFFELHKNQKVTIEERINTFDPSTLATQIDTWNASHSGGKILLVSSTAAGDEEKLSTALAHTFYNMDHVFIDELFWPPNNDHSRYLRIDYFLLKIIISKLNGHLWIAPHLYTTLAFMITKKPFDDMVFFLMHNYISTTTLSTTLRTTKQIHDFIIQKEWQDFYNWVEFKKLTDKDLVGFFVPHNDILKSVLYNSHGHHITGPPVRVISLSCNVQELDMFIQSSVSVIRDEVNRLCKGKKVKQIKYHDIAIISDKHDAHHASILSMLEKNLKAGQDSSKYHRFDEEKDIKNSVVICNSDEIASLEWPVVIHVKYVHLRKYNLDNSGYLKYFESYQNMIVSRCTTEYIIICCKGKEDAWPHSKSFQDFKLWCEKENETDAEAFLNYSKL